MTFPHRSLAAVVLALALVAGGCGGSGPLRLESAEEALERGIALYERGKYQRAVEYFQGAFNFGRVGETARMAQIYLARSYYESGQYLLAASEYTRFIDLYRNDPLAEEAEFGRAMSYYDQSPQYALDQSDTQRAIDHFQLFLNRYPQSEKKEEAQAKIQELREKLAHKAFETAGLYERRELYEAAALYYETAFDKYPDTPWADDALVGAIRSYIAFAEQSVRERQGERLQRAIDNYERLTQLFPESPLLRTAEGLYARAVSLQETLAENS